MSSRVHAVILASLLGILLAAAPAALAQTTWYVDDDAPPGQDGSSWNAAFDQLQDALAAASYADTIRVAAGTYKPADPGGPPTATFQLINGVAIYGGYLGRRAADPKHDATGDANLSFSGLSGLYRTIWASMDIHLRGRIWRAGNAVRRSAGELS